MAKAATKKKATRRAGAQAAPGADWPADIFAALKRAGVRQVAYVPDAGHTRLIEMCHRDNAVRAVPLTSEQEGIGVLAGAWLGGVRGALLMQSSGVGNCINMLAMACECRFPLVMVVTMRGERGEFNPWQVPMGQGAPAALQSVGVIVHQVNEAAVVGAAVDSATRLAFDSGRTVAVLISQRVVGFKQWGR